MAKKKTEKTKKKIKYKILCEYCHYFRTAKERAINETEERAAFSRFCPIIGEWGVAQTTACEDFIPYRYFWCEKCEHWMLIEVCLFKKKCRCISVLPKNCEQREFIKYIKEYSNGLEN